MLRRAASQNRARRARASSRRAPPSTSPSPAAVAEKFNTAVPPQARREVRHSRRSPCLPARLSLLLQRLWYRVYVYQNLHLPPPFVAHDVQPATCTLVIYLSFSPSILLSLFPSLSLSLSLFVSFFCRGVERLCVCVFCLAVVLSLSLLSWWWDTNSLYLFCFGGRADW